MWSRIEAHFLERDPGIARFRAFQTMYALVIAVVVTFGPYGSFFYEEGALLAEPARHLAWTTAIAGAVNWIRAIIVLSALFIPFGKCLAAVLVVTGFLVLDGMASGIGNLWSFNTHLHFWGILILCTWGGILPKKCCDRSLLMAGARVMVACVYARAGMSKVIYGGIEWMVSGSTPRYFSAIIGTDFGKSLYPYARLFQVFSVLTVLTELVLPLLLMVPKTRFWGSILAILLHLGIYAIMGISFWHLWCFFPVLFWQLRRGSESSDGVAATPAPASANASS